MTETAHTWYMHLERNEGSPSWPCFKNRCHLCFGPPVRSSCLDELTRLRMTGRVPREVFSTFGSVDALSTTQQVSIFTSGLVDLLKIDVELHNPQDLDTAMSLAHSHELRAKVAVGAIIEAPSSEKSSFPTGQLQGMPLTGSAPGGGERVLHRLTCRDGRKKGKWIMFQLRRKILQRPSLPTPFLH
jgi:hypothetical protein